MRRAKTNVFLDAYGRFWKFQEVLQSCKGTFYFTIFMGGQRATGKIQKNDYHHGSCGAVFHSIWIGGREGGKMAPEGFC